MSSPSEPALAAERLAFENFESNLPAVQPYLFNLADRVVEAAPAAAWNLIVCDDVSGRLPTYFLRQVLASRDHELPACFVAGSKEHHDRFGIEAYTDYFRQTASSLGEASLRPLVVTEHTFSGRTMRFLEAALEPIASVVQTAAVVNSRPRSLRTTYSGAEGAAAGSDVFYAFEALRPSSSLQRLGARLRKQLVGSLPMAVVDLVPDGLMQVGVRDTDKLLGLEVNDEAELPVASVVSPNIYTARTYSAMAALAAEYGQRIGLPELATRVNDQLTARVAAEFAHVR